MPFDLELSAKNFLKLVLTMLSLSEISTFPKTKQIYSQEMPTIVFTVDMAQCGKVYLIDLKRLKIKLFFIRVTSII